MSLLACEKCWEINCECGFAYKAWSTERLRKLSDVLNRELAARERAPTMGDYLDFVRNGAWVRGQIREDQDPCWRVYTPDDGKLWTVWKANKSEHRVVG